MKFVLLPSCLLLMASAHGLFPAFAQDNAEGAKPATEKTSAAADKDKLICKSFAETGSRLNKTRICKTAFEWQQDSAANGQAIKDAKARGSLDKSAG